MADPRRVALEALQRIEEEGAFANLLLGPVLERAGLAARDRGFVTELVYGVTRMRRACDFLVDRFVMRELDAATRSALRVGAYQLHYMRTPQHAAVSATVEVAPKRSRGLVNAVLRKVASAPVEWPDDATRLSYPDWLVDRLVADLGHDDALGALAQMNEAPDVTARDDGYVQDLASQWVAEAVGARAGERVADLCAAPGGKATLMAKGGATIVASDLAVQRPGLVAGNAERTGTAGVSVLAADAERPPYRPASFDRVLLDAPCSGLGVLRRRADARWRIDADAVDRLAALQRRLLDVAVELVKPGGTVVYSVCTLTKAEAIDGHPGLEPLEPPPAPWRPHGDGALLLPQAAGTDGMFLLRGRRLP